MKNWIDFKELRARLVFADVLRHYGVEVKANGEQHHGFCPLPNHGGQKRSASFSANLTKGIFHCFGCGAKGNALDFAVLMEKLNPENGESLRIVALKLQERFGGPLAESKPLPAAPSAKASVVNAPLDFELKGLDAEHPYLSKRGFAPETIAAFGLGYCGRGMLKGRVAIPLHDEQGRLLGYAGRLVDDAAVTPDNPKYLLPSKRERDGTLHEFKKSLFLYNGFRLKGPLDDLIVVEGFPSAWWLTQLGFPRVVALMGADCSARQGELIVSLVKPAGRVWLLPDGNDAGVRCAQCAFTHVAPHRFVRCVKLAENQQPTDFQRGDLARLLTI